MYEARPAYQASVVKQYLTNDTIPKPPSSSFNPANRGFPDVGAIGSTILIQLNGSPTLVGGTSASAPIWAGVLSLLNQHLLEAGKSPIGFANPLLYPCGTRTLPRSRPLATCPPTTRTDAPSDTSATPQDGTRSPASACRPCSA